MGSEKPDIYDAIHSEYAHILALLDELEATSPRQADLREELLTNLACEIEANARAEDDLFYPLVLDQRETRGGTIASREENRTIHELLDELLEMPKDNALWEARMRIFAAEVRSHIDREERELFPRARGVLQGERARELGEKLQHRREEILEELRGAM